MVEKALTVFAGQFCLTANRLLVQRSIADEVRSRLGERFKAVRVGPAADPSIDMGPMIDKANVERVDALVKGAIKEGARVVVRGGPVTDGPLAAGAFHRPTLLEVDVNALYIVQNEVFGPVLTMQVFATEDQAIALANYNPYGLAAGIWSRDVDQPLRVAQELQAGTIWVNDWGRVYDQTEEGGYKGSGLGRRPPTSPSSWPPSASPASRTERNRSQTANTQGVNRYEHRHSTDDRSLHRCRDPRPRGSSLRRSQRRPTATHSLICSPTKRRRTVTSSFVSGINNLLYVTGALALVGAVSSLLLIRDRDFVEGQPVEPPPRASLSPRPAPLDGDTSLTSEPLRSQRGAHRET